MAAYVVVGGVDSLDYCFYFGFLDQFKELYLSYYFESIPAFIVLSIQKLGQEILIFNLLNILKRQCLQSSHKCWTLVIKRKEFLLQQI